MSKHLIAAICVSLSLAAGWARAESPVDYVDPFVGTGYHGHTFPGAVVPHGMVQVSPDTRTDGWDACGGYHYDDDSILGFSHTHFSGTGCSDMGDFLVAPGVGKAALTSGSPEDPASGYRSRFSHDSEIATPGYYKVDFTDTKIKAEVTASTRAGFHRYTFPKADDAYLLIDFVHRLQPRGNGILGAEVTVVDDQLVTGSRNTKGWAPNRQVFFAARFSKPFKSYAIFDGDKKIDGATGASKDLRAVFDFDTKQGEEVLVKLAISSVSCENALENLDAEIADWDFDAVRQDARAAWETELGKIAAQGDDTTLKTFYTSLYHTMIFPAVYVDVNGQYRGLDQKIHEADGWTNYTVFSLWDTFRTLHPLYTIIKRDKVNDLIHAMMAHYEQSPEGMLPIWSFHHNETWCMIGYHSVPVIADAYLKGLTDVDGAKLLEAFASTSTRKEHDGLGDFIDKGYVPQDKVREGTSKTLAYAYDDWCIAKVAQSLGDDDMAKTYLDRAQNYHVVFDKETGFMRAKLDNGDWREPFDPHATHLEVGRDFTEGNAWQWTWFVPHDVEGLIELLGGDEKFVAKLDELFNQDTSDLTHDVLDVTGLIGEYAHGNEPSHHVAYLYCYAGAPWKAQEVLQRIMTELYAPTPEGISGNEDCGQMSAWYVMSAMGFYPVNPCGGVYILGKPMLSKAVIDLGDGKSFTIVAKNLSDKNIYVQSVKLNGQPHDKVWITHDDVVRGGTLEFVMGPEPNKAWGTADLDIPFKNGK